MKRRTIFALAFLVVVVAGTVWKVTRKDAHVRRSLASKTLDLKKEDVDELEIGNNKATVVLKKEGAEWKLVKPVADRADQKAVEQAIDALAELKLRDVIAESP